MKEKYLAWIAENIPDACAGTCVEATDAIISAFPELRRANGYVEYVKALGWVKQAQHCWAVSGTEIIDPTAAQYRAVSVTYREIGEGETEPVGKCLCCGKFVYMPGHHTCSEECARTAAEIYGWTEVVYQLKGGGGGV